MNKLSFILTYAGRYHFPISIMTFFAILSRALALIG
jgi:hypothetical protein